MKYITSFIIAILILFILVWSAECQIMAHQSRPTTAADGVTYLLDEQFEGAGSEETWTYTTSVADYDYTTSPAPLQGDQSCQIDVGGNEDAIGAFTPSSEIWVTFIWHHNAVAANSTVITIRDTDDNTLVFLQVRIDNTVRLYITGGTTDSGVTPLVDATTYWFKVRAKAGTGANAEAEVWISTNGTWGESDGSTTDGTWTADCENIRLYGKIDTDNIFDDIRVDDENIGDY